MAMVLLPYFDFAKCKNVTTATDLSRLINGSSARKGIKLHK